MNTLKQELGQDLDKDNYNPCKKVIFNTVYRVEDKTLQAEKWSIFTDQIKYVHHNERALHRLDLLPFDYQLHKDLTAN